MRMALFLMCIYRLGTGENKKKIIVNSSLGEPTSSKVHMGLLYPLEFQSLSHWPRFFLLQEAKKISQVFQYLGR